MASKACVIYHEVERLLAERQSAAEVAAAPFLRDLPLFAERGGDVLTVVPFRRAKIVEITQALVAQRDRVAAGS
jgi:hypothetical protein